MKIKPVSRRRGITMELKPADDALLEKSANVRAARGAVFQLARILVPMDFSATASKALAYALAFARQFHARVILLHVVEPAVYPENFMTLPPGFEVVNRDLVKVAKERLAKLREEGIGADVDCDLVVRLGRAYAEVTDAARELEADLIVLTTHGYTGLKHVLMGSTAERVVRYAPCPVLVVREREHDFVSPE